MPVNSNSVITALEEPLASGDNDGALRQRILESFERQDRIVGPRSVVISELVAELGISSKTLYQQFDSKAHIVSELMTAWADHWFALQKRGLSEGQGPRQRIEMVAVNWMEHMGRFSDQFWQQLERDFPDAFQLYQQQYQTFMKSSQKNLQEAVRKDLDPNLALSTLMRIIQHASDSQLCDQLNLTRKNALLQVIDLWAQGALKKEFL